MYVEPAERDLPRGGVYGFPNFPWVIVDSPIPRDAVKGFLVTLESSGDAYHSFFFTDKQTAVAFATYGMRALTAQVNSLVRVREAGAVPRGNGEPSRVYAGNLVPFTPVTNNLPVVPQSAAAFNDDFHSDDLRDTHREKRLAIESSSKFLHFQEWARKIAAENNNRRLTVALRDGIEQGVVGLPLRDMWLRGTTIPGFERVRKEWERAYTEHLALD